MHDTDGCEGPVGEQNYLWIYSVDEVLLVYERGLVSAELPGLIVFATNGGDAGYAFDTRTPEMPILYVSLSDPTGLPQKPMGANIAEWLERVETFDYK